MYGPGFQIWVSNLRSTSYFSFSFNLFLSNCWLLAFGFLHSSTVKPRLWTYFTVDYCFFAQQPRIRVVKPQVFNSQFLTQRDISFSRSNPKLSIFWFTLKNPLSKLRNSHWYKTIRAAGFAHSPRCSHDSLARFQKVGC